MGGGVRGSCTCNSVAENGSQPSLCYYQSLPGYTEAVKSVPKPSKALETVPCMEALTVLPRSNQTNAAAPGSPLKVLLLLLPSRMDDCQVTSVFIVYRPSNL